VNNQKFVLRRISRKGDETSVVTLPELQMHLRSYLGMNSAAVRIDSGEMVLIGSEFPEVMGHINGLVQQNAGRIE